MRAKAKLVLKHFTQLQSLVTWKDKGVDKIHPKCNHVMMADDGLVPNANRPPNDVHEKDKVATFLVPEHFDVKKFGVRLEEIGKQMRKGNDKGCVCMQSPKTYKEHLFGNRNNTDDEETESDNN